MSGAEWIYEYKLKTRWFNLAIIKKKFRFLKEFSNQERFLIEYKKQGEWHTKKIK